MSTIKKFIYFFSITFIFMFIGVINVEAINMTASSADVTAGNNITINFSDANISDIDPLYEFSYTSASNLERGNPVGFSGFDKLSFTQNTGTITFKTKDAGTDYNVTFTIKDLNSGDVKTTSVNVKTKQTITQPPTTTTAPPTTTQAKSTNANLASLHVTDSDGNEVELSPSFSSNTYEYSATVDATIRTINIDATMEDSRANMVISNNATEELVAGENNRITITVTAEDGTSKKAYVINIRREALTADATLKSLSIKEYDNFEFEEDKFSYNVRVANSVTKLTLDYEASSSDATVSITGNEDLENGSKVKILVTAEDGTKREYILNIVKENSTTKKTSSVVAEKNPLIIMALSIVAFGLIGGIVYVIKK